MISTLIYGNNKGIFIVICLLFMFYGCALAGTGVKLPLNSDFEKNMEGFSVYKGAISITDKKGNIRSGEKALKWNYKIKKRRYFFIAKNNLDPAQFVGKAGISVWLKSDKKGPLLFQVIENDNSSYQYINNALHVDRAWKQFELPFGLFEKDPDVADENNRLDVDQIKEFWIVDISGYYNQSLVGPRTVWVDDLMLVELFKKVLGRGGVTTEQQVIPSGPVGTLKNLKSDPYVLKEDGMYKMWFGANKSGKHQQIWLATSSDGTRWDIHPRPVILVGKKGRWDAGDIETPTVVKVSDVYHLWYCGRAVSEESETWSPDTAYKIGHATSKDGVNWVKDPKNPVIGLGKKAKNEWNWGTAAEPTVIYEDGIFKMWYVGVNILGGKTHLHVGYATSPDGSNWTNYPKNPVIASEPAPKSIDYNGYFSPFVLKDGNRYIIFYINDSWNGMPVGPVRYATSLDGINWTIRSEEILRKGDALSWMSTGIFAPSAIIEDGKLSIWYTGFRITTNFYFGIGYKRLDMNVLK